MGSSLGRIVGVLGRSPTLCACYHTFDISLNLGRRYAGGQFLPKHSKPQKGKRPWYAPKKQKTQAQKIMAYALEMGWQLRPQHLGIWVFERYRYRLFVTFTEDGRWIDCVLTDRDSEETKKLSLKQMLHLLKRLGKLYHPEWSYS